jgi:hypothetical protein
MTQSHMFALGSTPAPWSAAQGVRFSGIPLQSDGCFRLGGRAERRAAPKPAGSPTGDRPMYTSDQGLSVHQSTCVAMPSATSRARFTSLIFIMASSCAARMSGSSPSSMARVSLMNGA